MQTRLWMNVDKSKNILVNNVILHTEEQNALKSKKDHNHTARRLQNH